MQSDSQIERKSVVKKQGTVMPMPAEDQAAENNNPNNAAAPSNNHNIEEQKKDKKPRNSEKLQQNFASN